MNGQQKKDVLKVAAWIMCIILVGVVTATFARVESVQGDQARHNIDKEAHPGIAGKLDMIEGDIGMVKQVVDKNSKIIGNVHDEQIRQGVVLEQIKEAQENPRR